MNLIDLVTRKDKYLMQVGTDLPTVQVDWLNSRWRAVVIKHSATPQIIIRNIHKIFSLKAMPSQIGWFARCGGRGRLTISLKSSEHRFEIDLELDGNPKPVFLPWPETANFISESTKLSLHFQLENSLTAELLIQQCLNRRSLISLARGRGVEIGPGPKPQVHQTDEVEVSYVEESPVEKWVEEYDGKGRYNAAQADFSKYTIGTAWNLPQSDASLDFIFSSHVFEHLANPIGHLLRWKTKLKPGGLILAVVPDLNCTKDYKMCPSEQNEFLVEFRLGLSAPGLYHYQRWAEGKGLGHEIDDLMRKNVSIHVHYYTPQSMAMLLEHCVINHGFSNYSIQQKQNHKDFYFVLQLQ